MKEVQGCTSNVYDQMRSIRITAQINDLQKVNAACKKMTKEACVNFKKKYGSLLDLLSITVEAPVLSALAQFWNSNLKCLELPGLDLVPTIEEYEMMLRIPCNEKAGVYLYKGNRVGGKKIAKMIGLQPDQAEIEKTAWKKSLLEDHLERQAKLGNWENFNKTLALLIYGLVLFPFKLGMVDQEAMDVFHQWETHGANPIPAILAETLLSMEVCRHKNGGTLRCCAHLLYIWIMTHLYAANHMGPMPDPLKSFSRIPIKKQEARAWKEDFLKFSPEHFPWVCPWYHPKDTILCCGKFSNVPLMGPRGCITYTPVIALRQLKWTQVVPRSEELDGWSFQYGADNTNELQEEVRTAWEHIKRKGERELGKPRVTVSAEYKKWRESRRACDPTFNKIPHKGASPQESSPEIVSLTSQLETMKAQLRLVEEREAQARAEVEVLKRQCAKKDMEIAHLKEECIHIHDDRGSAKKARKEKEKKTDITLTELEKMHGIIKKMKEEMTMIQIEKEQWETEKCIQEKEVEVMQGDLTATRDEATKWRNLVGDQLAALAKANQNQERLRKELEQLTQEQEKFKSKVQKLESEENELVKEWKSFVAYYKEERNRWKKKCQDMTYCVQHHTAKLAGYFQGAIEEIGIKDLPQQTYELMKYCEKLTRSYR